MIDWAELKKRLLEGGSITPEEALQLANNDEKESLYALANAVREKFAGNSFETCSITNARSGRCSENCQWCAQSAHYNTNVQEYEMVNPQEAVEQACRNAEYGVDKYSLVTSGKAISTQNLKRLVAVYGAIRRKTSIKLCASMGLLDREKLFTLKEAGVEHYHCNLETARSYFPELCTSHSFDQKVETIKTAIELGLEVCSGGIIGMGETMEQRVEMAFELRELGIKSIPLNILNPIEGTPLAGREPLTDDEILTTFAIFRLINPTAKIRFAGGRNQIRHVQDKALKAGINAALVGDLLTTIGSNVEEDFRDFKTAGFSLGKKN